ncbi:MAG: hypothetical protein ACFFCS_07325, partial [Candidatus Hodarchaeota archaeon]
MGIIFPRFKYKLRALMILSTMAFSFFIITNLSLNNEGIGINDPSFPENDFVLGDSAPELVRPSFLEAGSYLNYSYLFTPIEGGN